MMTPYAMRFFFECERAVMKSSIFVLKNCRKENNLMYASTMPIACSLMMSVSPSPKSSQSLPHNSI